MKNDSKVDPAGVPLVRRFMRGAWASMLLALCCVIAACQTLPPQNDVLTDLQAWVMGSDEPTYIVAPNELPAERAAMAQWVEQYMSGQYRVIDQRYVLGDPGFTEGAMLGSKAMQYMRELGGSYLDKADWHFGWRRIDENLALAWRLDRGRPRYFVFVMSKEFVANTEDRLLIGYFEIAPVAINKDDHE